MVKDKITYVDLFSGAGGLSLGFKQAGFQNIFSIDYDHDSCETHKKNIPNHKVIESDIRSLTKSDILRLTNGVDVDIVAGGTPCQGFSMAGNIGRKFIDDPRNSLFKEFARVVSILKPKFIVIENVARLFTHNNGRTRKEIVKLFSGMGYETECHIINSVDYGVPQTRRRLFIIGNKLGLKNTFPLPTHKVPVTVKDAIGKLPRLVSGKSSRIPNHRSMNHSKQMLKKMSYVKDGGNRYDIPKSIRPKTGDVRKYIRYGSSDPSVCVTGDMRKIFHYEQNRALTVRELASLQSFPKTFEFLGNSLSQQQQVGNAVPPRLAFVLSDVFENQLILTNKGRIYRI